MKTADKLCYIGIISAVAYFAIRFAVGVLFNI